MVIPYKGYIVNTFTGVLLDDIPVVVNRSEYIYSSVLVYTVMRCSYMIFVPFMLVSSVLWLLMA